MGFRIRFRRALKDFIDKRKAQQNVQPEKSSAEKEQEFRDKVQKDTEALMMNQDNSDEIDVSGMDEVSVDYGQTNVAQGIFENDEEDKLKRALRGFGRRN